MALVHDVGLEQYPAVRAAYDKAKDILNDPAKRKAELFGLVALMECNKDGMEWLRLEEGNRFDSVYKLFQYHLAEDRRLAEEDRKAAEKTAQDISYEAQRQFDKMRRNCREDTSLLEDYIQREYIR